MRSGNGCNLFYDFEQAIYLKKVQTAPLSIRFAEHKSSLVHHFRDASYSPEGGSYPIGGYARRDIAPFMDVFKSPGNTWYSTRGIVSDSSIDSS
jgi:hypothetical protein